jgi:ribosomal protein L11 methyltransferase
LSSRPDIADLWRVWLTAPAAAADALQEVLGEFGTAVAYGAPALDGTRIDPGDDRPPSVWRIESLSEDEPDISAVTLAVAEAAGRLGLDMPDIHLEQVPAVDWLAQNRALFTPVRAGRFFVQPTFDETPAPPGSITLRLDAGPAFGSGQHPTTHGCLMAIDSLLRQRRFAHPLDLGCGSGILALAIAAVQHGPVLAIDNDEWSVRTTRDNARLNRLSRWIDAQWGDGMRQVSRAARFDLICANILARPLMRMAPAIATHLAPDGIVVLSGLLDYQEARVRAAYRVQGLSLVRRLTGRSGDGGLWSTLVLAR